MDSFGYYVQMRFVLIYSAIICLRAECESSCGRICRETSGCSPRWSRLGTRAGCGGLPPRAYTVLPSDTSRIEDVPLRSASAHAAMYSRTSSRDPERGYTGHSARSPAVHAPCNTAFPVPPDAGIRDNRTRGGVICASLFILRA